jgi:hypothetical protein
MREDRATSYEGRTRSLPRDHLENMGIDIHVGKTGTQPQERGMNIEQPMKARL